MASPIYARTLDGITDEVFSRFYRVSLEETGDILAEFGAAHIVAAPDARRFPPGSVLLDRYSGLRPSRNAPTPLMLRATPENAELIAAIRAMRPANVSHMQRHDNGCGTAVIAHLTGKSYDETARALFPRSNGTVRKIATRDLAAAINGARHDCASRTWDEATRAGAVAALIRAPSRSQHYVAMRGGTIIDPELVEHYALADYPRRHWTPVVYFTRPQSCSTCARNADIASSGVSSSRS